MSHMIRCPVICSVQVWTYSRMNDPIRMKKNAIAMRFTPARLPSAMYRSIASFMRYGWASCRIDAEMMAASASATCDL